jgi:hypothetical protein
MCLLRPLFISKDDSNKISKSDFFSLENNIFPHCKTSRDDFQIMDQQREIQSDLCNFVLVSGPHFSFPVDFCKFFRILLF